MTYAELQREMIRRGASKQQTNSLVTRLAYDIMSGANGEFVDLCWQQDEADKMKDNLERTRASNDREIRRLSNERDKLERELKEAKNYISDFNDKLAECENPEKRDAIKTAQLFINSVDVDTKYDNTAFIIGLASILSGQKIDGIKELKKINPKLNIEVIPRI